MPNHPRLVSLDEERVTTVFVTVAAGATSFTLDYSGTHTPDIVLPEGAGGCEAILRLWLGRETEDATRPSRAILCLLGLEMTIDGHASIVTAFGAQVERGGVYVTVSSELEEVHALSTSGHYDSRGG